MSAPAKAPLRVLYLAHDLDDSAVWRRAEMLRAGGADVGLAGFRRREGPLPGPALLLGRTVDARMGQRVRAVLGALWQLRRALSGQPRPDTILARNLEMLALAVRARRLWPQAGLAYEVLDIHRLMLGDGAANRALRALERRLLRGVGLILTSSPGFLRGYFQPQGLDHLPIRLVENRCFGADLPDPVLPVPARLPITIGWFGILRCGWSLDCLDRITRAAPGRYRVVLRGKPALDQLPGFHKVVEANPDFEFHGSYRNPADLPAIYGGVHMVWLIDRYDAGANSEWLLPNRLYEGCRHGAVPIALEGTEAARFLSARRIGVIVPEARPEAVSAALEDLTPGSLARLRGAVTALPPSLWTADEAQCVALVAALRAAAAPRPEVAA